MKDIYHGVQLVREAQVTGVALCFIYVILPCFLQIAEMTSRVDSHVLGKVGFRSLIITHKTFNIFIKPEV